jgi:hypothetical protein
VISVEEFLVGYEDVALLPGQRGSSTSDGVNTVDVDSDQVEPRRLELDPHGLIFWIMSVAIGSTHFCSHMPHLNVQAAASNRRANCREVLSR